MVVDTDEHLEIVPPQYRGKASWFRSARPRRGTVPPLKQVLAVKQVPPLKQVLAVKPRPVPARR